MTQSRKKLTVLQELATRYGRDTQMNYVSDCWGSEPGTMSPAEAIDIMCADDGCTDERYAVRTNATDPGEATLVEISTGNTILELLNEDGTPHVAEQDED